MRPQVTLKPESKGRVLRRFDVAATPYGPRPRLSGGGRLWITDARLVLYGGRRYCHILGRDEATSLELLGNEHWPLASRTPGQITLVVEDAQGTREAFASVKARSVPTLERALAGCGWPISRRPAPITQEVTVRHEEAALALGRIRGWLVALPDAVAVEWPGCTLTTPLSAIGGVELRRGSNGRAVLHLHLKDGRRRRLCEVFDPQRVAHLFDSITSTEGTTPTDL